MYCMHCMKKIENGMDFCTFCRKSLKEKNPMHHLKPYTELNKGRYIIGRTEGEGGFGITYIGIDTTFERKVAIKEYYPNGIVNRIDEIVNCNLAEDKCNLFIKGKNKFLNEARILSRFENESGIVHVKNYFEENNTAYIVMEYLDGQNLMNLINERKKLTINETLKIIMPVMKTLQKVHSQSLIHRDISPDNIMIMDEQVVLLDFGLAKEYSSGLDNKSHILSLKDGYAPEEQYRNNGIQGPWTDVYAICATIYKCITGNTPDSALDRLHNNDVLKKTNDGLKKPSELGVKIDSHIENAIMRGLSIKQEERFQSVQDLIDAINNTVFEKEKNNKGLIIIIISVILTLIFVILLVLKFCINKDINKESYIETTEETILETTEEVDETIEGGNEDLKQEKWSDWVDKIPTNVSFKTYDIEERILYCKGYYEYNDNGFKKWIPLTEYLEKEPEISENEEIRTKQQYRYRMKIK